MILQVYDSQYEPGQRRVFTPPRVPNSESSTSTMPGTAFDGSQWVSWAEAGSLGSLMFGAVILAGKLAEYDSTSEETSAAGKAGGGGVGRAPRRRPLRPKQPTQPQPPPQSSSSATSQSQTGGSVQVTAVRDAQQTRISYVRDADMKE